MDKVTIAKVRATAELPVFICDLAPLAAHLALARVAVAELQQSHPDSTPSNVKSVYMSPWKSHRLNNKLEPLCASVKVIAHQAARLIGGTALEDLNLDLSVTDCWAAIYQQADYTAPHNHFPADFACVVYLEADEGAAPLVLGGSLKVPPKPGTMVLFPGLLEHEVPATPGRRVVVAMNLTKVPRFAP